MFSSIYTKPSYAGTTTNLQLVQSSTYNGIYPDFQFYMRKEGKSFFQYSLNTLDPFNGWEIKAITDTITLPQGSYDFTLDIAVTLRNKNDMTGSCLNGFPQPQALKPEECYIE